MPTLENTGLRAEDPLGEEAHRYYDEARRRALQGNWEEAIIQYDQAIARESSYRAAYEGRADAYHALGRHAEAIRDYSRAIAIGETWTLYTERGHAFLESGSHAQADQDYHLALSLGPPSPGAYIGVGDAHRGMGEFEEAAHSYSEAIALDPDSWRAYYYRGAGYFTLRQFQRALADFEQVIALQPHSAGAHFARGAIYWLGGQCAEALDDFQAFIALSNGEERLSQGRGYLEYVKSATRCEPPPEILTLVSARSMPWR